ncbi:MAG TPA: formimidoylglutamase [Verrucomicrobiae bacterium]|nr:formimidoylglutamase [Verrucomicrobiae bacterium]
MASLSGVRPADPALFFSRGDASDPRLGERVAKASLDAASVAILGCPQDEGVRRNGGRPGAAQGPAAIRRALYKMTANGLDGLALCDAGDTEPQASLEDTHAAHEQAVTQLLAAGKRVIVLGGGNDISYPDVAALARQPGEVLAFNIDAHLDVRPDAERNSGTPYRQLLEEGLLKGPRFHELGSQPFCNAAAHAHYLASMRAHVVPLDDLRAKGAARVVRRALRESDRAATVFWGFDLDVVNASEAPGVSAPNPLGLGGAELCELAALAGGEARTRIVEFTEVNPAFDVDGRTARLAAVAIWYYLSALAGRDPSRRSG